MGGEIDDSMLEFKMIASIPLYARAHRRAGAYIKRSRPGPRRSQLAVGQRTRRTMKLWVSENALSFTLAAYRKDSKCPKDMRQ